MSIDQYREPLTRAVTLKSPPQDHATDNAVLFTTVAARLGLITYMDASQVLWQYAPTIPQESGMILRYPRSGETMSHDDMTAAAWLDVTWARLGLTYANANAWNWPGHGDLSRIVDFPPMLKVSARSEALTLGDQISCAIAWLVDAFFSSKSETSGKQLIWFKTDMLKQAGLIVKLAAVFWQWWTNRRYGDLAGMFAYYYTDPNHPFHAAAKGRGFN